jgi:hypothetical protein
MYLLLAAVPAVLPQAAGRLFALFALFVSFNGYYAVDVGSSRKCAMHGRKSRRFLNGIIDGHYYYDEPCSTNYLCERINHGRLTTTYIYHTLLHEKLSSLSHDFYASFIHLHFSRLLVVNCHVHFLRVSEVSSSAVFAYPSTHGRGMQKETTRDVRSVLAPRTLSSRARHFFSLSARWCCVMLLRYLTFAETVVET